MQNTAQAMASMSHPKPVLIEFIFSPESIGANFIASNEGTGKGADAGAVVSTCVAITIGASSESFVTIQRDDTMIKTRSRGRFLSG